MYTAEGSSPEGRAVVVGLRDSKVAVDGVPSYTSFLKQLRGLSKYVVEGGSPKE